MEFKIDAKLDNWLASPIYQTEQAILSSFTLHYIHIMFLAHSNPEMS